MMDDVFLSRLRKLLRLLEEFDISGNPYNKYYFSRIKKRIKKNGKTYVYDYVEVYSQAPRGADNARYVARYKPGDPELNKYVVESHMYDIISCIMELRTLIELLFENLGGGGGA